MGDDTIITVASTSDSQDSVQSAADDNAQGVPLAESALGDFRQSSDGAVISFEHRNSERALMLKRLEKERSEIEEFPIDPALSRLEPESEQPAHAPTPVEAPVSPTQFSPPGMVPADQVDTIVETKLVMKEHQDRFTQALQNPEFREAMMQVPANDITWNPAITMAVAAQSNSPIVTWFLHAKPELAQQIASMPVLRGVAEISKLASWLQTEMRQPQNTSTRRPEPPAPVYNHLTGSNTRGSVPLGELPYAEYKRIREQQRKAGR